MHAFPNKHAMPLSNSATQTIYQQSLSFASAVIDNALEDKTNQARDQLGLELSSFLQSLGSDYSTDLKHVGPEDLLVFMEQHWLKKHAGSHVPGIDHLVASPSGVNSAFSHLSTLFRRLGRGESYDEQTGVGNPCKSQLITLYKQGYGKTLWRQGYQESSAVPLQVTKLEPLVLHLDKEIQRTEKPVHRLLASRDLVLVLYNWTSGMRGKDGGQLCIPDFCNKEKQAIFKNGYDPLLPLPAEVWIFPTHGTKTNKQSRNKQDPVHLQLHENPKLCTLRRLWEFMRQHSLSGHPITHYIFRPLAPSHCGFKEAPLTSSCSIKMLQQRLKAAGLFNGETGHSLRRGGVQHTHATQGRLAAAEQSQIKTPRVLDRYLNEFRHFQRSGYHPSSAH